MNPHPGSAHAPEPRGQRQDNHGASEDPQGPGQVGNGVQGPGGLEEHAGRLHIWVDIGGGSNQDEEQREGAQDKQGAHKFGQGEPGLTPSGPSELDQPHD